MDTSRTKRKGTQATRIPICPHGFSLPADSHREVVSGVATGRTYEYVVS